MSSQYSLNGPFESSAAVCKKRLVNVPIDKGVYFGNGQIFLPYISIRSTWFSKNSKQTWTKSDIQRGFECLTAA